VIEDNKYLGVYTDNKHSCCIKIRPEESTLPTEEAQVLQHLQDHAVHVPSLCGGDMIFYAAVCWSSSVKAADANRFNKLIKTAGSVLGFDSGGCV